MLIFIRNLQTLASKPESEVFSLKNLDIYARVADNCISFYPKFTAKINCPEASEPSCRHCRNFNGTICRINKFDSVVDRIFK